MIAHLCRRRKKGSQGFLCGRAQTPGPSGACLPLRAPVPVGFWWWFEIAFPQNFAVPPNDPRIVRENSDFSVSLRAFFEMKDPKMSSLTVSDLFRIASQTNH